MRSIGMGLMQSEGPPPLRERGLGAIWSIYSILGYFCYLPYFKKKIK